MLVPTIVTIISVPAKLKDLAPTIAVLGGGVSGIICGAMLGRQLGHTRHQRIVLGVVFAFVMGAVCIAMNCFGCLAGGYNLEF